MSQAEAANAAPTGPGLYGKVTSKGDFLTRRLPRGFVEPIDAWLQAGMLTSRQCLGEDWAAAYLTAPIWRFVLAPGLSGKEAAAGILMPSVDRVGRHFPLLLVSLITDCANPWAVLASNSDWFRRLEDLALQSLDDDVDFSALEAEVERVGPPAPGARPGDGGTAPNAAAQPQTAWRFPITPDEQMGLTDPELAHQFLRAAVPRYSLWWCEGSDRIAPSLLVSDGLPTPDGFTALLDGQWAHWGWSAPGSGAAPAAASLDSDYDPELGI